MLLTNSYIIKTANITKTSVYHLSLRAVQGFADKDWMQGDSVPTEHSLSSWEQQITSGVFSSRRAGEHRKEYVWNRASKWYHRSYPILSVEGSYIDKSTQSREVHLTHNGRALQIYIQNNMDTVSNVGFGQSTTLDS